MVTRLFLLCVGLLVVGVAMAQAQSPVVVSPPSSWVPTILSGLSVAAFTYLLSTVRRRDERIDAAERALADLRLVVAKDYFSTEQASSLVSKLDSVIEELHKQNITLARVETELRANRQATLSHPMPTHQT